MTSPTSRTLAMLRDDGWTCAVVEKWNPHARIRQDALGFGDILCCRAGRRPTLVQCTSGSNVAARITKIMQEPRRLAWLASGGEIMVVGWRKVGPRGKRKVYEPRIEWVTT